MNPSDPLIDICTAYTGVDPLTFAGQATSIVGLRSSGTSSATAMLAAASASARARVVVLEPHNEWTNRLRLHRLPVRPIDAANVDPETIAAGLNPAQWCDRHMHRRFASTIALGWLYSVTPSIVWPANDSRPTASGPTPALVVVEEAERYVPESGGTTASRDALCRIILRGRSRGLGLLTVSEQPALLTRTILSQADLVVVMRLTQHIDRNPVVQWIGDSSHSDLDSALPRLLTGEAYLWRPTASKVTRVQFPPPPIAPHLERASPNNAGEPTQPFNVLQLLALIGTETVSGVRSASDYNVVNDLRPSTAPSPEDSLPRAPRGSFRAIDHLGLRQLQSAGPQSTMTVEDHATSVGFSSTDPLYCQLLSELIRMEE